MRIGLYAWFSPWVLGIYNHAIIAGMTAQLVRDRRCDHRVVQAALTMTSGGTAWELTPWRAVQRAAWEVLNKQAQ